MLKHISFIGNDIQENTNIMKIQALKYSDRSSYVLVNN